MKKLLVAVAMACSAAVAPAGTKTWTGAAGGSWSADANWDGGKPEAGDTVVLNASSVNDIEGLSLAAIQYAGSGGYAVSGNAVTVTGASGLTAGAGVTVTNRLPLTFSADQTWLVNSTATLVMDASFDAGAHTLTIGAESTSVFGTIRLLKPNAISGQITVNEGEVYVCDNLAFGTAPVKNRQTEYTIVCGRFIFENVTMANAFTVMDSNKDGASAYGNFKAAPATTNTFTGLITFTRNSYYPIVPPTGKIIFAGGLSVRTYWRGNFGNAAGGEAEITTVPVALNWLGYAAKYGSSGNGRPNVRFSCTGNTISGQIRLGFYGVLSFGVDDAIDLANSPGAYLNNFYGTVDLSGHSQHLGGFRNCSATFGTITNSSATAATLYMVQDTDYTLATDTYASYGGAIAGAVNFSKSGAKKLTLGGNTSAVRTFVTSGYLEVTEGDLELNDKAIWQSGDVRVSGSGNLILNATQNLPSTAVIAFTTNATSTAKITLNAPLSVRRIVVNGKALDDGTYSKDTLGDLIAGDESVVVYDPDRPAKTTTWTGAAGGKWSAGANWDNGRPISGDTVVLTAASENDISGLVLAGLSFRGATGYGLTGEDLAVNGPLAVAVDAGGEADPKRVFTNDVALTVGGAQTWTVDSTNTTLVLTKSVTAAKQLVCAGYGSLELRGDNALTGGFWTKTATVHAYSDAAFSATGEGLVEIYRNSAKVNRGRLWLHGVTLKNQIKVTEINATRHALVSAAGTTNVLQGLLTATQTIYPGVQTNSLLVFEGGVHSPNHNLFRPCAGFGGGEQESGQNDTTARVIVRNKPFTGFQGIGYDERCSVRFEVGGNQFTNVQMSATDKYSGVTLFGVKTVFETAAPYVFDFAGGMGALRRLSGTLDLCGFDQRLGGFAYLDGSDGRIVSDEPATLYVVQMLAQLNEKKVVQPLKYAIEGQVSLSKAGTNIVYLSGAKTTTGRLEVTEGDLSLDATFSWAGANVVIAGTNTVASMGTAVKPGNLRIAAAKNLNRGQILTVYGDGTLTFDTACRVSVAELWMAADGAPVRQAPGDYTKDNCSFVKGDGVLHVGGGGLLLILK